MKPAIACALAALALSCTGDEGRVTVLTGTIPLYRTPERDPRQDASGAIWLPGADRVLLVDDGGDPPAKVPLYSMDLARFSVAELKANGAAALSDAHGDLEGITFDGTYVYVASSLAPPTELVEDRFRNFSRFKLQGDAITDLETVPMREVILAALAPLDPDWFGRVRDLPGRSGGTNVEALSVTAKPGELLVGLRSPHFGAQFPGDAADPKTRTGDAVLVRLDVREGFAADRIRFVAERLDLGGLGFRAMEYSPTAKGFFILAGIVEQGRGYALYFWRGGASAPVPIALPEFDGLCRPEAVTELVYRGKRHLLILSEESGNLCADPPPPFTYLLVELNDAFLSTLD